MASSAGDEWKSRRIVVTNRKTEPPIKENYLEAVKVLHHTVVDLRKALEKSHKELRVLRNEKKVVAPSIVKYENTVESLALENHVLRKRILLKSKLKNTMAENTEKFNFATLDEGKTSAATQNNSVLEDANEDKKSTLTTGGNLDASENDTYNNVHQCKTDSSEDSEEVDDIELIFTTDDSKPIGLQEQLEPISDDEIEQRKGERHTTSVLPTNIKTHSVLVETDISKCGILVDDKNEGSEKENNLYVVKNSNAKDITCRAFLTKPIIIHETDDSSSTVRDCETQTDISAVPPCWKSESYLTPKQTNIPHRAFPTLPSKFVLSGMQISSSGPRKSLRLTDKTEEARRVLLSDINFTSMVPELSRSVDHLCQHKLHDTGLSSTNCQMYLSPATTTIQTNPPTTVKFLRSPALLSSCSSYSSKFEFSATNSNWNSFEQDRSSQDLLVRRRQSWRPSLFSLDTYCYTNRTSSVPPSPTSRCHSAAPVSNDRADTHFNYSLPDKTNLNSISNITLKNNAAITANTKTKKQKPKVSFKESKLTKHINLRQSLPNIHVEVESGDESTESLIEESEEFVRKAIDTSLNLIEWPPHIGYRYSGRTYSVPNLFLEFSPPPTACPFIARSPNDLKINYFVKVINKDGKVVGGRIQFVGSVPGKTEPHIGIILPPSMGESDGTFQNVRLFHCEKNCALFVPFRKVVMAWKV